MTEKGETEGKQKPIYLSKPLLYVYLILLLILIIESIFLVYLSFGYYLFALTIIIGLFIVGICIHDYYKDRTKKPHDKRN
jgi:hypothetical protein